MQERETEIRDGILKKSDGQVVHVQIKDDGEGLKKGEPSNHDKVEIVYKTNK